MSAKALQRVFPTTVASLDYRGWIRQEALCHRSSAAFVLRQCAGKND